MIFRFWFSVAARFLIRSGKSTLVLYLMVFSAVGILIFLASLAEGVNDAMVRNSVGLFSGHISGVNLPDRIAPEDLAGAGVRSVLKRVPMAGLLTNQNLFAAVTLVGIDPAGEKAATALWEKTVRGNYPRAGHPEIFLSSRVAEQLRVGLKDSIFFSEASGKVPVQFTVSGLFETGIDNLDRGMVFCPVSALPRMPSHWSAAVFLDPGVPPDAVIKRYGGLDTGPNARFSPWYDLMPALKQLIDLNYVSMNIVVVVVFAVVSLGIACAFTIFILKNIREYGMMKAMGVLPFETVTVIFSEVIFINLAASAAGMAAGALLVFIMAGTGIDLTSYTSHNPYFVVSGVIYPRLTAYSLWTAPGWAFGFSILAAVWPSVFILRKKTADILRSR